MLSTAMWCSYASASAASQIDSLLVLRVYTEPLKFLRLYFPVTAEVIGKRHAFGITAGLKPNPRQSGFHSSWGWLGDYEYKVDKHPLYNMAAMGMHWRSQRRTVNFRIQVLYRYWWFDNKYLVYEHGVLSGFKATRTERQHMYSTNFITFKTIFPKHEKPAPVFADLYFGLAVRYQASKYYTFNGLVSNHKTDYEYVPVDYRKETEERVIPSVHLGLMVGVKSKLKGK